MNFLKKKSWLKIEIFFLSRAFFQGRLGKGKQIKFKFRPGTFCFNCGMDCKLSNTHNSFKFYLWNKASLIKNCLQTLLYTWLNLLNFCIRRFHTFYHPHHFFTLASSHESHRISSTLIVQLWTICNNLYQTLYIGIGRENQFIKMAEKYNKQETEKVAFLYEIDLLKNSYQSTKVTKLSSRQVHVEIAKYHIYKQFLLLWLNIRKQCKLWEKR